MTVQKDKFDALGIAHAPGQEVLLAGGAEKPWLRGDPIPGPRVDFSHGDVDAHPPTPGALAAFEAGVAQGGSQAYTEYSGDIGIRRLIAARLAAFTGAPVEPQRGLIVTPGTQGALFLAIAACVERGDKVAIVEPDYFANRKLVAFFEGQVIGIRMNYLSGNAEGSGLDLDALEQAFRDGARLFLFSNPNNPAGVVYAQAEIDEIARLAQRYDARVIVDQLYARLVYAGVRYAHLRAADIDPDRVVTIMGPSKTESLSGYRLGVAFGSARIIARMEKLQAIVSLRAPGYSQAVLRTWFDEPEGWMEARIRDHEAIRDRLVARLRRIEGARVRPSDAGSYLFPELPALTLGCDEFVEALRLQAQVIVTRGPEFGPTSDRSVRLNFSQAPDAAEAAVGRLAALVDRYRA